MRRIQYDELVQIAQEENLISISDVENVVEDIIFHSNLEEEVFGDFDYANSPRKKLRDIAKMFVDSDYEVIGSPNDYHNLAVSYAKLDLYDGACKILQRGVKEVPYSVDLLADLVRYGISGGQFNLCEEPYTTLSKIPKSRWNWRAFSFSIDYLLEKANYMTHDYDLQMLKQQALELANQFIEGEQSDQAYFDKSTILLAFGSNESTSETEESILELGLKNVTEAPKCALRLADIQFEKGMYSDAIQNLQRCSVNVFKPQPDINGSYAFLLRGLSNASLLFSGGQKCDYSNISSEINSIYKDFHTALNNGLNETYERAARSAIKIIASQTDIEYPYTDETSSDRFEF